MCIKLGHCTIGEPGEGLGGKGVFTAWLKEVNELGESGGTVLDNIELPKKGFPGS